MSSREAARPLRGRPREAEGSVVFASAAVAGVAAAGVVLGAAVRATTVVGRVVVRIVVRTLGLSAGAARVVSVLGLVAWAAQVLGVVVVVCSAVLTAHVAGGRRARRPGRGRRERWRVERRSAVASSADARQRAR